MSYQPHQTEDYMLDRMAMRHSDLDHYGSHALHGLDPAEIVARMDDERHDPAAAMERERGAVRSEVLNYIVQYVFFTGVEPAAVRLRLQEFISAFSPDLIRKISGPDEWVSRERVRWVVRKRENRKKLSAIYGKPVRQSLRDWVRSLETEDNTKLISRTIAEVIAIFMREGANWRSITAIAYGLGKALHPQLIGDMSLDDIAVLSGDAGRAAPCDRIQRLYTRRIAAESGGRAAKVPFQKSAETVIKYQLAQIGNSNRINPIKTSPRKNQLSKIQP